MLPEYASFVWQMYREKSYPLYRDKMVMSERRAQQGDSLGPWTFSAMIQPLIKDLKTELNVWHFDDWTLGRTTNTVVGDTKTILAAQDEYGLELNVEKCEVFVFGRILEEQTVALREILHATPEMRVVSKSYVAERTCNWWCDCTNVAKEMHRDK